MRGLHINLYFAAICAGAMVALVVTWGGDWLGMTLEGVFQVNLRSWELAAIQVALLNAPGGAVVALLGACSGRWSRGLVLGVAIHAVAFLGLVTWTDSFRAAPASVHCWVVAVGVLGGACAGAIGGALSQAGVVSGRSAG